jgi:glycosyltransferase involved in cell wall biosynthesis
VRQFLSILREESPDILHIQSGYSARRDWLVIPRFRKHCEKLVMTVHNVLPHDEREKNAAGMSFTLGRIYHSCDRMITHSSASKDQLIRQFGIEGERIEVVPHGNYSLFSGDAGGNGNGGFPGFDETVYSSRYGHEEILFFGHLREYKGVDVLIRAFSRVRRMHRNVYLVIAGKEQGNITEEFRRIMADEGVSDSVLLKPGYVKTCEMGDLFANARLVVFPYRETDGSGALQLAYSFGKPVIATSVGILPEIVEEGINGFLVPPEDPEALANAINRFLGLPRYETDKMGKMSSLLAEKLYGWDRIARMTLQLYRSTLENTAGAVGTADMNSCDESGRQ